MRPSEKKIYKCLRPESICKELEDSLSRLKTTHIDLYQTHWQDATTPIADTMACLLKLKDQGKIRAIGVCNANQEHLKAYGRLDSDQEKCSLLDRDILTNGTVDYCRQQNVAVLAYSPLANGLLTGKLRPDRQYGVGDLRRANRRFTSANVERINATLAQLQPMADRHQATLGQLVIAWTCGQPGMTCVLCGARDPQQAIENAAAGRIVLSADEIETIAKIVHT
jgi:methylglyoxal reductase